MIEGLIETLQFYYSFCFTSPLLLLGLMSTILFLIIAVVILLLPVKFKRKFLFLLYAILICPLFVFVFDWFTYRYAKFDPGFSDRVSLGEIDSVNQIKLYKVTFEEEWADYEALKTKKPKIIITQKDKMEQLIHLIQPIQRDVCLNAIKNVDHTYILIFESDKRIGYIQIYNKGVKGFYISPIFYRYESGVHGWPNCHFFEFLKQNPDLI